MSKQRYLDTKFWDDNYIIKLDPVEKLIFIYCLTNPLTNILGIYEISLRRIAFDTGIDQDMVIKILGRFEKDNKIKYDNGYIVIKNFTKYQKDNPSINRGIEILIPQIPPELLKWVNIDQKRVTTNIIPQAVTDGIQTVTDGIQTVPYYNNNNNPNLNNKEEDKEEEKKEEEMPNFGHGINTDLSAMYRWEKERGKI